MSLPRRQREEWPLPLRGRWLRYFGIGIAVITSPIWGCAAPFLILAEFSKSPPTRDAPTLRRLFSLPEAATIVSGQYDHGSIMGGHGYIRFTLPNTRTPEQWTASIARESGSNAIRHKNGPSHYGRFNGEGYRVKFLEIDSRGRRIYEAETGWD